VGTGNTATDTIFIHSLHYIRSNHFRIGQQSEGPAVQAEGLQVRVGDHGITPQVADDGWVERSVPACLHEVGPMETDEVGWFCLVFHHGMDHTGILGFGNGFRIVDRFGVTLFQRSATPTTSVHPLPFDRSYYTPIRRNGNHPANLHRSGQQIETACHSIRFLYSPSILTKD